MANRPAIRNIPLTDREQRLALGLAGAAALIFAISLHGTPVLLGIGWAMAAGLALGAYRRNRVGTAVGSFITAFGPWGFGYILGAPFLILAFNLVAGRQVRDDRRGPRR